ncbi:MAG: peptidylprolyl isomerase [Sphingomonas sp. 28-66-16]|nr:MAG: peptidylprolyl isomerase [Sphingomonas sp. 28-66-16]
MLTFIRRLINSRTGVIFAFVLLGTIAVAFAVGDVTGIRSNGSGSASGSRAVTVGKSAISVDELKKRVQDEMESFRQQRPTLTMQDFLEGGGFEGTLERYINTIALDQFAQAQGMVVSKQVVDSQIASIPGLQGPDGKFSQTIYERLLAQRKLTDAQVRTEVARSVLTDQLTLPTVGASQVPNQLATPYASLLLEKRTGLAGFVPTRAMGAGAVPTDAEISTFYTRNIARYTIPERRVIRYAIVTPDQVKAGATPTESEIAKAYQQQAARFAATEKRSLSQVVIGDKAAADALVAKVKAGTPIDAAAKAIGLDAAKINDVDAKSYATQTSPEIAAQVFKADRGAVIGPIKAPLGWSVVQVGSIAQIAAKTLDQARPELVKELTAEKTAKAMADLRATIEDAINDKSTLAEIASDRKLQVATTNPVIADGRDPTNPTPPDPKLAPIVAAGFAAETGDDPQLVPFGTDDGFAVVALDRVVAPAAPPKAELRDVLMRDFTIDRARRAARKVAAEIVAKVNKGTPLKDALAQASVKLPGTQPLAATRASLAANPNGAPPALALMFSMVKKTAKLLEAPEQGGWLIIYLDTVEERDASGNPQIINAMRADLGKTIGREYVQQFTEAVRRSVGVTKNDAAIAKARADLSGAQR